MPWIAGVGDVLERWVDAVEIALLTWSSSLQVSMDYVRLGEGVAHYRLRTTLLDGSMLQCAERASLQFGRVHIDKYSFHWQRGDGSLIRRWDNAPHHPEIASFPHHVHEGDEIHVLAHEAVDVFGVLELIEMALSGADT